MRHIYRGASRVLVWLGPEQDESDSGMELICDVGSAADDAQLFPLNESELFRAAAVEKIVRRPYWRRAWIRQEVTVPSSEPLIICGNREILWNLFDTGLYRLYKHRATERLYRVAPIVLDLRTTRNSFHSRIRREDTVSKERTNLHSLLGACRMTLATDPRDQVYGLLGLIRSVRDHSDLDIMIPDYTKSLSSVYLEAAKMYMRLEGTLEFLRFRARHPARSWLPSWVPDFSLSYDMDPTTYPSNAPLKPYKWSATGALRDQFDKPYPSLGGDGGSALITKGVILDRVAKVVEIDGTSPKAILKVRKAVLAHGAQPMTATHSIRDTVPDRELEERIWRTLVKNCDVGGRPPCPPEYGNYYYEILNDNHSYTGNGDKPTPDDGRNFLKAMRKATKATYRHAESHRQVLLFEGGIDMIGLGPPDSEHGDLLCLLGGYSMPALLRRSGKSFLFVGSVFVHGIMYGEALGSRKLSDEFVII
ncbi:hypothetical protein QBC47DRAFT_386973 [Echria macrotheca]|uniref:Heterokaryon incompatibility domain-containing protein n=1 Tax=Echria macrotheca TaxID=438768 RepID=A0AAJ0B8N1_9PEZI|nr:hypothetical protein QBC47DRAFT_386973 [Echria macrotheca]